MSFKKKLSTLIIGASMVLMAQSAFAATTPVVTPETQSVVQAESNILSGNMWFQAPNLQPGTNFFSQTVGAVYQSNGPHTAKFTAYQNPVNANEPGPAVRYQVLKMNSSGTYQPFTLYGTTSQSFQVQLEQGTYFVLVENIGTSAAFVHGTLSPN
ncbi:hypothetical protein [Paenibacillus sp. 481]|uniref:hypothetical protein n=1 Tax=Paenibacillus sp. 481 TaxID=2835869 RepID=UPI001E2F59BF|nr:hypothetical protein [Paenibacillus sp. 481]UHA74807.1 hypothetical protein KIK04_07035 [Paenibacillus sp. 481]